MITDIELKNYRCYDKHKIKFNDFSIIVWKNNAWKSTLIEALRLISLVTNRYKNLPYKSAPADLGLPVNKFGISPSLKWIEISLKSIFHLLWSSPAQVTVNFKNNTKIELFINEDFFIHAVIFDETGKIIKSKAQANMCILPEINILPQIWPLKEIEDLLEKEYVKSNIFSNLASSHFRNQLQYFEENYSDFCKLTHETWQTIEIREFIKGNKLYDQPPSLLVQDWKFVAEIGWMGHWLQMWLQTMWFLARCKKWSTIILDEPDVYLHADLQRKLIRFLKNRFNQVIVATHSIEIISEVDPENILIIDKNKVTSKYSTNLPAVQEMITSIGSIQNLELIKCWSSKKFIILEWPIDDITILKIIQDKIFPNSDEPLNIIPTIHVGGWSWWQRVIGSKLALKDIKDISVYCIFDSDYHLEEEKNERLQEARKEKINLHIWSRKEIENYLVVPEAILRFISIRHTKGNPNLIEINNKIEEILTNMKDDIVDNYSNEIRIRNKWSSTSTWNKEARKIVNSYWISTASKLSIAPGKELIWILSDWSKKEFWVSFNAVQIAKILEQSEINKELVDIVTSMEKRRIFT